MPITDEQREFIRLISRDTTGGPLAQLLRIQAALEGLRETFTPEERAIHDPVRRLT